MKKEIRQEIKNAYIAQGGKLYNFNLTNIARRYNVGACEVQNAMNYFRYSPQQAAFREKHNVQ